MLTELHDYQLTPAGIFQIWSAEGAEPYEFPICDLLCWAAETNVSKYGAHDVYDWSDTEVVTFYPTAAPDEDIPKVRHFSEWWADVQEKDRLLLDFINAEITGRRDSIPAAFATEQEKNRGSADGLPII